MDLSADVLGNPDSKHLLLRIRKRFGPPHAPERVYWPGVRPGDNHIDNLLYNNFNSKSSLNHIYNLNLHINHDTVLHLNDPVVPIQQRC